MALFNVFTSWPLLRFVPFGLVWNVTWCRWMQIVHLHRTFTLVNCTAALSKLSSKLLPLENLPFVYTSWCFQLDSWSVWLSMISHQKLPGLEAQALGLHHWSCGNGSCVLALEVEQLDQSLFGLDVSSFAVSEKVDRGGNGMQWLDVRTAEMAGI